MKLSYISRCRSLYRPELYKSCFGLRLCTYKSCKDRTERLVPLTTWPRQHIIMVILTIIDRLNSTQLHSQVSFRIIVLWKPSSIYYIICSNTSPGFYFLPGSWDPSFLNETGVYLCSTVCAADSWRHRACSAVWYIHVYIGNTVA